MIQQGSHVTLQTTNVIGRTDHLGDRCTDHLV